MRKRPSSLDSKLWENGGHEDSTRMSSSDSESTPVPSSGTQTTHQQHFQAPHDHRILIPSPPNSGKKQIGLDEDPLGMHHYCRWEGCTLHFLDGDELYKHICTDHITKRPRKKSRSRSFDLSAKESSTPTLYCKWENCSVSVQKRDHLTSHARIHIDAKPFECQYCTRKFKRPQDLKKHYRIHRESASTTDTVDSQLPYAQPSEGSEIGGIPRSIPGSIPGSVAGDAAGSASSAAGYSTKLGTPLGMQYAQGVALQTLGAPLSAIGGAPPMGAPYGSIPQGMPFGFSLGAPPGPHAVPMPVVGAHDKPEAALDAQTVQNETSVKQEALENVHLDQQQQEKHSDNNTPLNHALRGGTPLTLDAHTSPKQQNQPLSATPTPHSYPPSNFNSNYQQHMHHPSYIHQQPLQPTQFIFPYVEHGRHLGNWHPAYVTPHNEMNPMLASYPTSMGSHQGNSGQQTYFSGPEDVANPLEQLYGTSSSRPSDASEYQSLSSTTESEASFSHRRSSVSYESFPPRKPSVSFDSYHFRRGSPAHDGFRRSSVAFEGFPARQNSDMSYDSFGTRNSTTSHDSIGTSPNQMPQMFYGSRRPSLYDLNELSSGSYDPPPQLPTTPFPPGTICGAYGPDCQQVHSSPSQANNFQ